MACVEEAAADGEQHPLQGAQKEDKTASRQGSPSLPPTGFLKGSLWENDHSLRELFATISHEFRTPLAVIEGYVTTLQRHRERLSTQEQDASLQSIGEAGRRLTFLTDRLLEWASLEAGTFPIALAPVNVALLAREALTRTQQRLSASQRAHLTFQLSCRDALGAQMQEEAVVQGDARCLRKILDHLLDNAVRFSPEKGRVDVVIRPVSQTALSSDLQAPSRVSWVEVCVCDLGISIPQEQLKRVFEPFYQVERGLTREVTGLGLGLTLCSHLVALHNGRIWAESCPSGGNALHIWLPCTESGSQTTYSG